MPASLPSVRAGRGNPRPRRPQSVYFFAVSFVTVLTSIAGSTAIVAALTRFIGSHSSPISDTVARIVVLGGLVTGISMVLLVTHLRRGLFLARADSELNTTPSRRVGQSYVSGVAFVVVLLFLVVTVLSVYLVFSIAGPGVFGSFGGRAPAARYLVVAVYLGLVAVVILWSHRDLVPPGLRVFPNHVGRGGFPGPQPGPGVPPGPLSGPPGAPAHASSPATSPATATPAPLQGTPPAPPPWSPPA